MPRSRITSSPFISWLAAGFIAVVLVLMIAVPVTLNLQGRAIRQQIDDFGSPASALARDIQTALSHEVSGIVGFQASGESKYTDLYAEQQAFVLEKLSQLEKLGPNLGPFVEVSLKDFRHAVERWHGHVDGNKLASVRLSANEFRNRFFAGDATLEPAHQAAARFSQEVEIWRGEKRSALARIDRLGVIAGVVLSLLALISIFLVRQIVLRLRAATTHLEARLEEEERLAKEEEALREVAHSLTAAVSLEDVLQRVTKTAAFAAQADGVVLKSIDSARNEITVAAAYGEGVPPVGTKGTYIGSFAHHAVQTGTPIIIGEVRSKVVKHQSLIDAETCDRCAGLVVPLVSDKDPLGALVLLRRQPKVFTGREFPRLQTLGDMAAVAMRRALMLEKLRNLHTQEEFVSEAAAILASSLDYEATLKAVARLAVPRIADCCLVHLADGGKIRIVEVAHVDPEKMPLARELEARFPPQLDDSSGVFRVIQARRSELHGEITDEMLKAVAQNAEHLEVLRRLLFKSVMTVPLTVNHETFGALSFLSEQSRRYDADDLAFAEDVARHAAFAIKNAQLYKESHGAVRARDEVLRVVSHDLRNPINNINMAASMLLNVPDDRRASRGIIQIIKRASERMNHLIEDLTGVARIHSGQDIPLRMEPENALSIVQEAYETSKISAESKSIDLVYEAPAALPLVKADRERILQVLYNLIDNALKFTPSGGSVVVRCESADHQVRFSVKDTGRGIDETHLSHIFDLYWQAKPTAHLGSGIGLAIAKSIVEQHGGTIWAESKPGIGSTFFFTLLQAGAGEEPLEEKAS
jgi:signal transduction histidine kinase